MNNGIYKNMKDVQNQLLVYIYELEQGQKKNINIDDLRKLLDLSCGK